MNLQLPTLTLLLLLLLSIQVAGALPAGAAKPEQDVVLTILHTNDMHGRVMATDELSADGPGGFARIATLVRQVRAEMPNVLVLDAGDLVHNTPTEAMTRGDSMMRAMNALGYDVATLGNHEFGWGQDITARNIATARFPFLSANAVDKQTGKPFGGAKEYAILNRAGLRIAVFGVTSLETVAIEWAPFIDRVRFEDPIATAKRLVPELRKKADIVIGLTHIGFKLDQDLAAAVPDIDIIIGGHSHTVVPEHVWVGNTVIAQAGDWGKYLGRMDLLVKREGGRWRIASVNGRNGRWWADAPNPPLGKSYPRQALFPIDESIPYDAAVLAACKPAWDETQAWLNTVVAEAPEDIQGFDKDAVPSNVRRVIELSPLPHLMADLLREQLGADVGITSAAFGPKLSAGPVTVRDIHEIILGYSNQNILKVRVTGGQLREAIRYAYEVLPNYTPVFAGVSGRFVYDTAPWRVDDLRINGAPLRDDAAYVVVAPSFIIRDNPNLEAGELLSSRVGWQKPIIADAMKRRGRLVAPPPGLEIPPRPARMEAHKAP